MRIKLHNLVLAVLLLALTNSVKAQPGNALSFNGSNQSVTINNTLGNFGTGDFTLEAWFRTSVAGPGTIVSKRVGCVPTNIISITVASSMLNMEISGSSGGQYTVIFGNTNVADGKWHHVATQRNGSVVKLFLDGVADASNVSVVGSPTLSNSANFVIGNTACNYFFNGSIDEVRVYNTALTQANIQADMFSTSSSVPASLQAYYNFDASSGTVLTDQTANGNNGTLVNAPSWVESYAMVVPTATAATNAYTTSLTANWTAPAVGTVTNYLLDVSTSSTFASFVSGYNGLSVSGTTKIVSGLTASTTYYYRVRADKTTVTGQGGYSNTVTTATTNNALPPGNALNFDGTNDNVSLGTTLGNFGTGSFTVEAWFKTTAGGNKTIIGKRNSNSYGNFFRVVVTSVAILEIDESTIGNYTAIVGSSVVNDGKWHHVAAVRTPTQILLYVDGKQDANPVTINANPNISNSFPLSLAQVLNGSGVAMELFNGSLDEVRIWNTARTASEIQNNFLSIISNSATGLLAYYNFDHGTAGGTNTGITTLTDQTSNANNGTLGGPFALTGATSNWVASTAWNTWTGTTSNAFATATNWQLGTVPTTVDNIVIPTGASNLPVMVTGTEAVSITGIQTATSATVTGTLKIAGPIYNSGTLTATSGTIELNGTSAQTIATSTFASNTVQNLTVNNAAGVTLGGALNVTGTLTPTLGTFNTGGFLTLKSNATSTARIANSAGTISGNVTIERFIPAKATRRFSFVTSPVSQALSAAWQQQIHITGAGTGGTNCPSLTAHSNGFDATATNAPNLFSYDASQASGSRWVANTTGTTGFTLTPGTSYRLNVRGARSIGCNLLNGNAGGLIPTAVTLSATGTVDNASKNAGSFTNTYNNNLANNWVLIGNPYPSELDFSLFRTTNSGVINASYIIYDPQNAPNNVTPANMYSTWNAGTWSNAATSISNANGQYIANGQAFFVQATAASNITLNFTEAHKYNGTQNGVFRTAQTWNDIIRIALNKDAVDIDQTVIRYSNEASTNNNRLGDLDATLLSSSNSYLGTIKASNLTSIQTRSLQQVHSDSVALDFNCSETGNYSFNFSEHEQFTTANIYLLDNYTKTTTEVKANPVYSFSVDKANAATQTNRFVLVFNKAIVPVVTTLTGIKMYPNPANKNLTIELPITEGKYTVRITDVTGKQVYQNQLAGGVQAINISKLAQGNYVVEVTDNKGNRAVEKLMKQ